MTTVARHLSAVVCPLAVAALIAHAVPAGAFPFQGSGAVPTGSPKGCAGETWRVEIRMEHHERDREKALPKRTAQRQTPLGTSKHKLEWGFEQRRPGVSKG
jgi:hypothetical protein